jgi:hypothetical protein
MGNAAAPHRTIEKSYFLGITQHGSRVSDKTFMYVMRRHGDADPVDMRCGCQLG